MSQASPSLIDRFRQPEYVGENRCTPCTIVNVVIALLVSVVAWFVTAPAGATIAGSLAGGVLVVSLTAIYLRGYLVPGTPTLTKRYFPDSVLRWFEKEPGAVDAPVAGSEGDVDPEPILLEAGAVEFCEGGEDLCATSEFASAWREEIEFLRNGGDLDDRLADALEADPDEIEVDVRDSSAVVTRDDQAVAQWESEAALLADAGAYRPLSERVDAWEDMDVRDRGQLLNGVRVFLEECPSCDGPVGFSEDTRESCCREVEIIALECTECESLLLEVEAQPPSEDDRGMPSPEDVSSEDLPPGVELTEVSEDELPDHISFPAEASLPPIVEELPEDVSRDDLPSGVVPKDEFLEGLAPADVAGEGPPQGFEGEGPPPEIEGEGPLGGIEPPSPPEDLTSEDLPAGVELLDVTEDDLPDAIEIPEEAEMPHVVDELPEDVSERDLPFGVVPIDHFEELAERAENDGEGPPTGPGSETPEPEE